MTAVTRTGGTVDAPDPDPPASPVAPDRSPRRWSWAVEVLLYVAAAALATAIAARTLRLWEATWSVPFLYVGDAVAVQAHAKTVLETGWYETQPALGAPAGQQYHDFPTAENLHMLAFRALGWVLDDSGTVMNAYFVLGFPLAAVTGLWFLRRCGVSALGALVLAVLFAVSPYHFERSEGHLFLASYWTMPPALGVVVLALRGAPLWGRNRRVRGPASYLLGPGALTVVAMALLGTSSTYYSVFVALLLAAAGTLALVRDRHVGRFLGAAGAGVALVATMVANMAPDLLYARARDVNVLALSREPGEAEVFALKPVQLVLPSALHRFERLQGLRREYNETFPLPSESPALGLVAAVGLVLLLVFVAVAVVRPALDAAGSLAANPAENPGGSTAARDAARRAVSRRQQVRRVALAQLAVLCLVAVLSATVGGLSSLIAVLLTDNLRGWSRMTIVIALLALAGVGLAVDAAVDLVGDRWRRRGVRPLAAVLAAGALLAVGTVDQTSPLYAPAYAANAEAYSSDGAYVAELEAELPAGAMVFQLPFIPYPESPDTNGVLYTDQIRMYLHSSDLRWSAGGIRGRPEADWGQLAAARGVDALVAQLAVAGFAGVHLDGRAYPDDGEQVAIELSTSLGPPLTTSSEGRYRYWSLAGVLDALRDDPEFGAEQLAELRQAVLEPVVAYLAPDFTGPGELAGRRIWNSRLSSGDMLLDNPRDEPAQVRLTFSVASSSGDEAVEVTLPGRDAERLTVAPEAAVSADLTLPPGRSVVHVAPAQDLLRDGGATVESSRFQLLDVVVDDPVLTRTGR